MARIATRDDRRRLSNWRKAWVKALGPGATGPPGRDRARGAAARSRTRRWRSRARRRAIIAAARSSSARRTPAMSASPSIRRPLPDRAAGAHGCVFTSLDGSQRPMGRIFPDSSRRMIFLGTLQLGDEAGDLALRPRQGARCRGAASSGSATAAGGWSFPHPHFEIDAGRDGVGCRLVSNSPRTRRPSSGILA